jgi:hypothetical protein
MGPWGRIHNTSFLFTYEWHNKLVLHNHRLERVASDKRSNLFGPIRKLQRK